MSTSIDLLNQDLDNFYKIKALHIETVEDLPALYSAQKDHTEPISVSLGLTPSSWMN